MRKKNGDSDQESPAQLQRKRIKDRKRKREKNRERRLDPDQDMDEEEMAFLKSNKLNPLVKIEQLARDIARHLREKKRHLIVNVIQTIGAEGAVDLLEQTRQVQLNGGMKLPTPLSDQRTGKKRFKRTSGGVYIFLLRERVSKEQFSAIMSSSKKFSRTLKSSSELPGTLDSLSVGTEQASQLESPPIDNWLDRLTS